MKYYIIPAALAERLNCKEYRRGSDEHGYIVNQSDLAPLGGEEVALSLGAEEIQVEDDPSLLNKFRILNR